MLFAAPDSQTVAQALKVLEHYTRGAKAWFEDEEQAWIKATLEQRTDDTALGVARLVFVRDSATSTTAQLVAQTTPMALHGEAGRRRRASVRAATADELKRVVARGSRLTGGRISSRTQVDASYVFDILFTELLEKGADAELLPPLCNPAILDSAADLTTLSYLHEPAVLYNLRRRYERHDIYTYSGVVLVAMNPFSPVALYGADEMARYARSSGAGGAATADPHLFAIAENAYRGMVNNSRNQTIIVYGESGSGKTTSAKYIMRYFAQAHHADANDVQMSTVENQILATNPVFESFGNAKTTRNDNSSRFGKFLDIKFERQRQRIVGGRIRTFLLERSRVVYQPPTERNYHIFYQLLAGADASLRSELHLDGEFATCGAFHYTSQGGPGSAAIAGVDDAADFAVTAASLDTVGISSSQRGDIWRTLAGILHLGNVTFAGTESTGSFVSPESEAQFGIAAALLGVGDAKLRQWLTKRQIVTRHDHILARVNRTQALVIRDSIAKFVYSRLFDWILGPINASLLPRAVDESQTSFVGVLDIYGFEHFEHNSFEQFCINYANEKLQQNFNHHVFKLEQDEYQREQLASWTFIGFQDNQPCIDLIEGKPIGILALLDEESRLEQGSDRTFTEKLYRQFAEQQQTIASASYFRKPRFSNTAFTIRHYAHDVTYEGDGFLEKNKDTVPDEILDLLCTSSFEFVGTLVSASAVPAKGTDLAKSTDTAAKGATPEWGSPQQTAAKVAAPTPKATAQMQRRQAPTLTGVFKRSLAGLLSTLAETEMHYIRCIKPNEAKQAWMFEAPMVLSQLRSCGVIETIRISKAGYPSRVPIRTFNERYAVLLSDSVALPTPSGETVSAEEHDVCRLILETCLPDRGQYQVGLTKVFFRAGQWAIMEKKRSFLFESSAVVMQKHCRGALVRRSYHIMVAAARTIQRWYRRRLFARKLELLRRMHAVRTIERYYIALQRRRRREVEDQWAMFIQARWRGFEARRRLRQMLEDKRDMDAARARDEADAARRAAENERMRVEQARKDAESERIRAAAQAARAKAQAAAASMGAGQHQAHSRQRSKASLTDGSSSRDSLTQGSSDLIAYDAASTDANGDEARQDVSDALARLNLNTRRPLISRAPLTARPPLDMRPPVPVATNGKSSVTVTANGKSSVTATANGHSGPNMRTGPNIRAAANMRGSKESTYGSAPDIRRTSALANDVSRQRSAEARASLLAAGVAERNAEAELMRQPHNIINSSNYSMYSPTMYSPSSTDAPHMDNIGERDSLTIGDDLFAIINEFSAVADSRYGEVDARSLRRRVAHSPVMMRTPASRSPVPTPRAATPTVPMGQRSPARMQPNNSQPGEYNHSDYQQLAHDPMRTQVIKRDSHTSVAATSASTDYGRHTAARARAWAARQKDRMFGAFGDKSQRRAMKTAAVSHDQSYPDLQPPSALRFHHQSHSATDVGATPSVRLSKVPSAGNLR
ncbi:Myosin type-2 heavy chain 1 [Coemansia sp. RSA 1822]|nr:Myosin type-2 heavy chain 1 [Coemansia sp. RSA 638]KAJ2541881.1 Myosin type-2 heavy chain 1 [Coemansia sp. RSA 1853]KAJ2562007.1 Myosin type-2 heavy chain 1 [Coemansia sp. RSA 1822]